MGWENIHHGYYLEYGNKMEEHYSHYNFHDNIFPLFFFSRLSFIWEEGIWTGIGNGWDRDTWFKKTQRKH